MGYIREPKNIDLVVGPSVLTEETKNKIKQAIAQYKKSGQKPVSVGFVTQGVYYGDSDHPVSGQIDPGVS